MATRPAFRVILLLLGIFVVEGWELVEQQCDGGFQFLSAPLVTSFNETESSRKLVQYTEREFSKPKVIKVTDNVHVAIGFALGNSIMIEGMDGVIIVDTTENTASMREILVEFRKITNKPVKAIILTHFHADHIFGTEVILEEGRKLYPEQKIDIYSHKQTKELMKAFAETFDIGYARGVRQLGILVPRDPNAHTGAGIGRELRISANTNFQNPVPTVTFSKDRKYSVAGLQFQLIYSPGETDDQLAVWFPETRMLLPADNFYKTFPNLYAIRGSPARDFKKWYSSLDRMRKLKAVYLVPQHTTPIDGADAVDEALLVYRDAIKFIHDQSVRLYNKGYLPSTIVKELKLPDKLASHPYLQEHYGSIAWSIRGVFGHYLGWFSGDPNDLEPMDMKDRGEKMIELANLKLCDGVSGIEALLRHAQMSLENSHRSYVETGAHITRDDQWALQLASEVLESIDHDSKWVPIANRIKISALTALGIESVSPNGRNYYLTVAIEIANNIKIERTKDAKKFLIQHSPMNDVLDMLCLKVNGLQCQHQNYSIKLIFSDLKTGFVLNLRNSVCDVLDPSALENKPQASFRMTSKVWHGILEDGRDMRTEIKSGNVTVVKGWVKSFEKFIACFDPMV